MKFLLLPPNRRKTAKARTKQATRVFLEDGNELTGIVRLEFAAEREVMFVNVKSLLDRSTMEPASSRAVIKELTLTFDYPEIEHITKAPKSNRKTRNNA